MPMYGAAPPPMPQAHGYDLTSGWGQQSPFPQPMMGQRPPLPSPQVGMAPQQPQHPPMPMSANPTGGPAGMQAPMRANVSSQLYRLGKQMKGPENLFGNFDPALAISPPDPLAAMGMAAPPMLPGFPPPPPQGGPAPLPALPPSPTMGAPTADALQGADAAKPPPMDRFPRLARLMGRPVLPPPDATGQGKKRR